MDTTTMDPDELIRQMLAGGSYQPQMQQLQQRIAMGQQMMGTPGAQGAHVGNTYTASSPLEHLSVAIQRMIGARMVKNGQAGEQAALGQVQQGRKSYADAILGASQPVQAPPDMIAAPGMDQGSQEQAQQGRLRQLGLLGSLSGDPQMAQAGASAAAMPGQLLAQAMQRQELAAGKQSMEQSGPQAALGGLAPNTYETLTKRQALTRPEIEVNPVTGGYYNRRGPVPSADAGGGGTAASIFDKRLPTMQEKFAKDMDPNAFRSGVLKGNQERANSADRLLQLAVDPLTGGPANLTPQQMSELSTSLASLLSGGGAGSEGQRAELTPYTKGRSFAGLMQWLTDKPQGAEQQAFVQQMIDTAKREKGVVEGQIAKAQGHRLANHLQYLRTFPNEAKAQMDGYGIDPSAVDFTTGKYTPKAAAPAAPRGAPSGRPQRTVNGETREWDGKAWVPVHG